MASIFDSASLIWDGRLAAGASGKLFPLKPNVKDLTGDFLTVARAGTKWVLGANGLLTQVQANTPAFEYNADGTYRGCLVEPAGTNLALRSQDFGTTWTNTGTTEGLNSAVAPDGASTADKLQEDTSTGSHSISQFGIVGATGDGAFTFSCFVKAVERDIVRFEITGNAAVASGNRCVFNLSTGSASAVTNIGAPVGSGSARITALPNGWYKCELTSTPGTVGNTARNVSISIGTNASTFSYTGVLGSGVLLWQADLIAGSVAQSPIPTVDSTASRLADNITLTGASSLIGQQEGTVYAEGFITNFAGGTDSIFTISDGTVNNRIEVNKRSPNTIALERVSAIQSGATTISSGALSTGLVKIAIAYKTGDTAIFINGVQAGATSTATFTMPTIGNLILGANATASIRFWNSNVRALVLLPTRLTNAQLQALTTP